MLPKKPALSRSRRNGFALVVTLSLMILLTILAVGLLSLSSVVLRSSTQGDAQAKARANARMALILAIGQLQREMGPDSRISAPHDLGNQTGAMPRWVGVWDSWKTDSSAPDAAITPQSRVPKFRSWLVSGANGTSVSTGATVQMLNNGSLGDAPAAEDLVSAPLIEINDPNRKGKIAWWTSDESVKAKVNAGPESKANPAFGLADAFFNAQSPPNTGHKAFPELSAMDWKAGQRAAAVSTGGLNLAADLGASGVGGAIHDLTVHSAGVLADVRESRLRRDLSNLLARPATELQNKPLYLADGRMNRFAITDDGAVSNAANLPANATGANRWGINLEELHLFHQLHREIDWSSGKPQLVNKGTTAEILADRFFLYRKPNLEAVNVMLSFVTEPDSAPNTYKLAGMVDVMVAASNPNDIPIVWPSSVHYRVEVEGFPYRPHWSILKADGANRHSHTVAAINRPFLQSAIRDGFTVEPGEAAVFGASTTDTQSRGINLKRGYVPRGGIRINEAEWSTDADYQADIDGLRAGGLLATDTIDFTMRTASFSNGNTSSGWISCLGEMRNASAGTDIRIDTLRLAGGGNTVLTSTPISTYLPSNIRPPQRLAVSNFIGKPVPVLMVTAMPNVEKSRAGLLPPNAIPSRPYHILEPAVNNMIVSTNPTTGVNLKMQETQLMVIGESMDYEFGNDRTMAAGVGGRSLYHGGARDVALGGSFNVIKRRIPLTPPLSLGSFENAIACGFVSRMSGGGVAFSGAANGPLAMAKSIGNSWSNPFLSSDSVTNGTYHDTSWMVNNALWDSWFLSGIVDGRGAGSSVWLSDTRSPRAQFDDFAQGKQTLRNKRYLYHSHKALGEALDELFQSDENFQTGAINKLPNYLLVDGAFNVNSTSETAWKAFLMGVKEQELLDANGAAQKKGSPLGTLGYAVTAATSGTEGDWNGFRDLSDAEIDSLAKAILVEVKARGPFLNMADFVNRRPDSTDAAQRALGALQAAIDKSGLNNRFKTAGRALATTDVPVLAGKDTLTDEPTPARSVGSAGYLSQAALLTAFGPQIAVRGDTFVIRAYGDHRDASDNVISKVWCEAVVQRTPEYVDPTDSPETSKSLTTANTEFGRKFNIVSFRWLSPGEI